MNTQHATRKPGDLDPGFAEGGILTLPAAFSPVRSVVRNDGKLLTLGRPGGTLALMRHLADGALDESFGDQGIKTLPVTIDEARLVIAPDDSAYLLSSVLKASAAVIQLVKVLPDGEIDTGFGENGICQLRVTTYYDRIQDIIFQDDGKIVVLVMSPDLPTMPNFQDYSLARLDNGQPDSGFGHGQSGIAPLGRNLGCQKAVQLDDGRFVLSSYTSDGLRLYRCRSNGRLDPDFGEDGTLVIPVENSISVLPADMAVQPDGNILIVGDATYESRHSHTLTTRITPDGELDPTFNGGVPMIISFLGTGSQNYFVSLQEDGKIVTAGASTGTIEVSQAILMRFLADGTLDASFGDSGRVIHDWGGFDLPFHLGLQKGKGIVASGTVLGGPSGVARQCVRYLA